MGFHPFSLLLELLFPKSDLERRTEHANLDTLSRKCAPRTVGPFAEALFPYRDTAVRELLWTFKYHKQAKVAQLLGFFLFEHLLSEAGENSGFFDPERTVLIPIPTTAKRRRKRGYDQALLLAREIEKQSRGLFVVRDDVLFKKRKRTHQTNIASRTKREENIRGSFKVLHEEQVKEKTIILIDDVITTGATVSEARKMLLQKGALEVRALCVAH